MDGNKDDAIKCIGIAKAALSSGDEVRAKKFIEKAKRLDPGLDVTELLSSCPDTPKQQSESQESQSSANPNPKNPSPEKIPNGIGGVGVSGARPGYTAEQVEIVRKVRRNNKDYYAVLGLEKSCSIEDVRKAYRKLSLKVHPDKNKAPGSEEAFKSVSKAFQCLSNEETRRQYDVSGPDEDFEVAQQQRSQFRRRRAATGFHDDFFDADEIFRSFFYGTSDAHNIFQRAHVMRTRTGNAANRGGAQESGGFNMASLLQILPVLLLFLISFLPSSEPQYSLQKAYPYQFRQVTEKYGVPYYVRSVDFGQDYKPGSPERSEFERPVIRDYVNLLGRYCHMEMSHRRFNRNAETPHCDQLKKFEAVR